MSLFYRDQLVPFTGKYITWIPYFLEDNPLGFDQYISSIPSLIGAWSLSSAPFVPPVVSRLYPHAHTLLCTQYKKLFKFRRMDFDPSGASISVSLSFSHWRIDRFATPGNNGRLLLVWWQHNGGIEHDHHAHWLKRGKLNIYVTVLARIVLDCQVKGLSWRSVPANSYLKSIIEFNCWT